MNTQRIMVALLVMAAASTMGWTQDSAPTPSAEGAAKTEADAPKDAGLSSSEKEQIEGIIGKETSATSWAEVLAEHMMPQPFPKKFVVRIDEKYAYPHIVAGIKMEYVREDDDYIWLRGISPEDPNSPLYRMWAEREAAEARAVTFSERSRTVGDLNFLDFSAVEIPPPSIESLEFAPVTENLPNSGRWQMGFAVADMNEDGHADLVFPPRRKDYPPAPSVFLGDGAGNFAYWRDARWPPNMPWDYGGVAVADLDGDGHQDVIYAFHFKPQFVLYGDGKGNFPRGEQLPSPDQRLSSRAVVAADFDGDERQDLAFIAEIDYDVTSEARIDGAATVWVLFNRGGEGEWEMETAGLPVDWIADVIRAADLDGDGRPELVLSSNTIGRRRFVFSFSAAEGWLPAEHRGGLSTAYHYGVVPMGDELMAAFVQFRMIQGITHAINGLVRYPPARGDQEFVVGTPVVWDKERSNVFFRLGTGDLNGDGHFDVVASRRDGGLEVYLQTAEGEFYRERGSELDDIGRAYDIRILDLDGDGFEDIVAACTPQDEKSGGVFVWLTKPTV